jgi:hypothetical protein
MLPLLPYLLLSDVVCSLVLAAIHVHRTSLKLTRRGWHDLVERLHRLNVEELSTVARDFLEPQRVQTALEPLQIWELVGGYEGLKRMRINSELMIALAAHAQQWNFEEGVIVSERMRRDALRLRRAILQVRLGMIPHIIVRRYSLRTPFYVHEATSAYYLMRQRLLALYETSHAGLYPRLAAAL